METDTKYSSFEIILGTYEEFVLGYKVNYVLKKPSLVQSFATHDHCGSIRAVANGGKFLASGASDDRIFIYDLVLRREHTVLSHHTGTVTDLSFTNDGSHLLSASEDGSLAAVRTGNWHLEKVWAKAHGGGPIQTIAIHSSGKMALTLGNDITLRTWNLVKGRQAYIVRLQPHMRSAKIVTWAPDGRTFAIASTRHLEIWDIECGGCINKVERSSTISCVSWLKEYLIVGEEDGSITVFNSDLELVVKNKTHTTRIKCVNSHQNKWIVSADSSGKIILWSFKKQKLKEIAQVVTGCRVTCMTLVELQTKKNEHKVATKDVPVAETHENGTDNDIEETTATEEAVKKRTTAYVVEEHEEVAKRRKKHKKKTIVIETKPKSKKKKLTK